MPSADQPLSALRTAAAALLADVPLPVVRATLRALLADADVVTPAEVADVAPVQPKASPPPRAPAPSKQPDLAWDTQRRAIRAAMQERGVAYPALAKQFGVAVPTLRHALGRRQPPTLAMRKWLDAWLRTSAPKSAAPAVAAEPSTFRPNGVGRPHAGAAASSGDGAERAAAG
jgi:hypothetical protein